MAALNWREFDYGAYLHTPDGHTFCVARVGQDRPHSVQLEFGASPKDWMPCTSKEHAMTVAETAYILEFGDP